MSPPVKVRQEFPRAARFDPKEIKKAVREVEGFNAKLALVITRSVGTMACAYVFALIALISLPDAIKAGRPAIISWIAQTFLQLVLLSIIMVGQSVQSAASDVRAVLDPHPEVVSAYTVAGESAAVLLLRARDTQHLERTLERIREPTGVIRTQTQVVLSAVIERPLHSAEVLAGTDR